MQNRAIMITGSFIVIRYRFPLNASNFKIHQVLSNFHLQPFVKKNLVSLIAINLQSIAMPLTKSAENRISFWYEQYRDQLSHFAMRLGFQHCESEDLINQLFLELWEKQTDLSSIEQPKSFLLTALKRRIIDQHRKKKNALFIVSDEITVEGSEPGTHCVLEAQEDQQQLIKQLERSYAALPKRLQEIVYLKYYKGLSTNDIAASFGISNRTVYNSLFEAVKMLRSRFSKK